MTVFAMVTRLNSRAKLLKELEGGSWTHRNSSESGESWQDREAFTRGADKVMTVPKQLGEI